MSMYVSNVRVTIDLRCTLIHVYDDVAYVYDDVTYVYDDVTIDLRCTLIHVVHTPPRYGDCS